MHRSRFSFAALAMLAVACHSGPGMVEQAMFVPTTHGDVLVTIQRGDPASAASRAVDEHISAYSVVTGETLATAHIGARENLRCAPALSEYVWCVAPEEPIALYDVAAHAVGTTKQVTAGNPGMPALDTKERGWIDPATRALVVQTVDGHRWAIDARTLSATRYAGDAATMARIGEQPDGCDGASLVHLGGGDLELKGATNGRVALFRDAAPLHPELGFYQGRFVMGDDCRAVELDDPASVLVADEGSSRGGGDFARVGLDGALVWRSPSYQSPYSTFPSKREGDRVVVVMQYEIAAVALGDGRELWRRSF